MHADRRIHCLEYWPLFELQSNIGHEPRPQAEAKRTLEDVGSMSRLCNNPVFRQCGLCKPLILLDSMFETVTFHTVCVFVRRRPAGRIQG